MSKKKIAAISALSVFFAACVGYIGYFIYNTYYVPSKEDGKNDELRAEYHVEELANDNSEAESVPKVQFSYDDDGNLIRVMETIAPSVTDISDAEPSDSSEESKPTSTSANSLNRVRELNGKVKAWLYIKDTTIDYPVVQATDNDYYLSHDINGYRNVNGAIYLDCEVDLNASQNIVVYGHYMNANVMFHGLHNYKQSWFGTSHNAYFDVGDGLSKNWALVGCITCPKDEASKFCRTSFTKYTIKSFIENIKSKRLYAPGIELNETDQYLTLVTCSYEKKNYREIVVFKRI